jgi:diguanylate cyclase (GGDEF)-like protein/PAS domain S-box-containing protein
VIALAPPRPSRAENPCAPQVRQAPAVADAVLSAAFEKAPVAMALAGPDGGLVRTNRAWSVLFGGTPAGLAELAHPEDAAAFAGALAALLTGTAATDRRRLRAHRGGCDSLWLDLSTTVLGTADASLLHVVALDVTAEVVAAHAVAESERSYRQVVDLAAAGIWILDRDWTIRFANPAMAAMLGLSVGDLVGRPLTDFLDPDARDRARRHKGRRDQGVPEVVQNSLVHADGRTVWVRINATPTRDDAGAVTGSLAMLSDVTHERAMERALAERERRYSLLVDHLPGCAVLVFDRDLRVVTAGGSALRDVGLEPPALVGHVLDDFLEPQDVATLRPRLAAALAGGPSGTFEFRGTGNARVALIDVVPLTRDADGVSQILVATRDVTDLKRAEAELEHLADHDPLTGLLNRRGFATALARHAELAHRYGPGGALLMIDLDHFKAVNDSLGHSGGDEVIVGIADLLRDNLRGSDVAARLGGDEFAVILARGGREEAEAVADRIVRTAAQGPVTLSIGVAAFDDPAAGAEDILVNADRAMYRAKTAGRNRYGVHHGAL